MYVSSHEQLIRASILNSIERETLLLKKYEDYQISAENNEWNHLLTEFTKNSEQHIDLLKNKLLLFKS